MVNPTLANCGCSTRNCLINSCRASRPWCTAGARRQNGACLPPYTRSRDPKIGPTSIYQTVSLGSSVNRGKKEEGRGAAVASTPTLLHRPELLHQAQMVLLPPVLGDLAVFDAGYEDARKTDPLTRRLDAHQLTAVVRLVDVAHRATLSPSVTRSSTRTSAFEKAESMTTMNCLTPSGLSGIPKSFAQACERKSSVTSSSMTSPLALTNTSSTKRPTSALFSSDDTRCSLPLRLRYGGTVSRKRSPCIPQKGDLSRLPRKRISENP